jgi:hypothetical protein
MNNLYEYGGSCDVIIRCNSERKIGNKTYKEGEPYTILKNVFCNLTYKNNTSEGFAKTNVLAAREGKPDIVNITNIVLNEKICDLIATRQNTGIFLIHADCIADGNKLYLPETPDSSTVFVYDKNLNLIDCTVQEDTIVGVFEEGEAYLVFYNKIIESAFDFTTPHYGYFSLEIFGHGNINKGTGNIYMKFPAVSLMSVPVFNMVNGTILSAPLQFECIYKSQTDPYFGIGN